MCRSKLGAALERVQEHAREEVVAEVPRHSQNGAGGSDKGLWQDQWGDEAPQHDRCLKRCNRIGSPTCQQDRELCMPCAQHGTVLRTVVICGDVLLSPMLPSRSVDMPHDSGPHLHRRSYLVPSALTSQYTLRPDLSYPQDSPAPVHSSCLVMPPPWFSILALSALPYCRSPFVRAGKDSRGFSRAVLAKHNLRSFEDLADAE